MKQQVKDRQTLLDVALQASGDMESVFDIAQANDISVTEELTVGTEIEVDEVGRQRVADYLSANKFCPASASEDNQECTLMSNDSSYTLISNDGNSTLTQN